VCVYVCMCGFFNVCVYVYVRVFYNVCVCEGFVMCGCFGKCILYSD